MATRPESMGIYADIAKKRNAAYDVDLEKRIRAWMEGLIGHPISGSSFQEGLLDMVAVCEVINAVAPGKIKKIRNSPVMLFRRENFVSFSNACKELGVPENDLCQFEDIYDNKNMGQFLITVLSLARIVQNKPGYKGPILEDAVKVAEVNKRQFTEAQLRAGQNVIPLGQAGMAEQSSKAMEASRYVQHGIIMNPDDNPHNKKK